MPVPKKKYRKGYTIFGMNELYWKLEKGEGVFLREKAIHPGFLLSMQLRTVAGFMEKQLICEAIDQKKEYYDKRAGEIPCHSLKKK